MVFLAYIFSSMYLWQSQEWESFQKKCGHEVFRLDGILGIQKKLPFKKSMIEIPRAEVGSAFWEKVKRMYPDVVFARFSPKSQYIEAIPFPHKKSATPHFPSATRIVDLNKSFEDIFYSFSATCRRHIRIAEKRGVKILASDDVKTYSALAKKTADRDGFSTHSEEYFRKFLQHFGQNAILLTAQKEDIWLAAGIFVCCGETGIYYYGASDIDFRALNAPTMLQFGAMQWAKKMGATHFDLLGTARDEEEKSDALYGVSQFKRKFSGKRVFYEEEMEIVFRKYWFWFLNAGKTIRRFFRRKKEKKATRV